MLTSHFAHLAAIIVIISTVTQSTRGHRPPPHPTASTDVVWRAAERLLAVQQLKSSKKQQRGKREAAGVLFSAPGKQ